MSLAQAHARTVGSAEADKDIEEGLKEDGRKEDGRWVITSPSRSSRGLIPTAIIPGLAYCTASASLFLLNKAALSSFAFHSTTSLLLFQCTVSVGLVLVCQLAGLVRLEPFSRRIAAAWFPVNLIFVGMIWTSFRALQRLGVPMATVLKNLTNLLTIFGDMAFFGKRYGGAVWGTLALMALSALCGGATDLAFDLGGYLWQLVNCCFTAGYSLYLRGVIDKISSLTSTKSKLDEFSMVFYNNLLSLPLLLGLMAAQGEMFTIWGEPALRDPRFIAAVLASSLLAFSISFASLWFLSTTTATTYSLVGSLNKIPVAVLGLVFFDVPWTPENLLSVAVGLLAGVIFIRAKGR